ncbi:CvpA family protein [Altererythrobacter sp. ZODW24]|uniref:CvpA family protein n=1 Tax=Altererythrobacter sp. ZODW24 TaxID=2185142 RepID=UPI000DF7F756|nr:CvpA family protein [Altererythrobacter sp. ZODW24]
MTGLDILVLVIVGVGAIGGFMRGFVQEILSLASWLLALFAIHYLHTDLTEWLVPRIGTPSGASVLAFALLLLIPYAAMKLIANNVGKASRNSLLGPIDRVLGFGFGAIKGLIIVVMAFSLLVLGYDTIWGEQGRPTWISNARSYTFVDSSSKALVDLIEERRESLRRDSEAAE